MNSWALPGRIWMPLYRVAAMSAAACPYSGFCGTISSARCWRRRADSETCGCQRPSGIGSFRSTPMGTTSWRSAAPTRNTRVAHWETSAFYRWPRQRRRRMLLSEKIKDKTPDSIRNSSDWIGRFIQIGVYRKNITKLLFYCPIFSGKLSYSAALCHKDRPFQGKERRA